MYLYEMGSLCFIKWPFPYPFHKKEKGCACPGWPSVMNEQGKGCTTHFIIFYKLFYEMAIYEMERRERGEGTGELLHIDFMK